FLELIFDTRLKFILRNKSDIFCLILVSNWDSSTIRNKINNMSNTILLRLDRERFRNNIIDWIFEHPHEILVICVIVVLEILDGDRSIEDMLVNSSTEMTVQ